MPRFFLEEIGEGQVLLQGEDGRHIAKALRMQPGEELTLCDTKGFDYHCRILSVDGETVLVEIVEKLPSQSEVPCTIRLYQAMPKGDKLELIVQKATELGVDEIVPVVTARCISRPHVRSMEKKTVRLQKIAFEAAKQSGRGKIPQVLPMQSFGDAVQEMAKSQLAILFYEESSLPLHQVLQGQPESIAIMVGSEGGFSAKEASQARDCGIHLASLGKRILRCETAPLCALSAILYHLGEF